MTPATAPYARQLFVAALSEAKPVVVLADDGQTKREVSAADALEALLHETSPGALFGTHAEGLVMERLPSDKDLIVPLMRELLEMNGALPDAVRLAIANDAVVAMVNRRVASLSKAEVGRSIDSVMALADQLDDGFKAKYGGTSRQRRR